MRSFADSKGRTWVVEISVPAFKRLKALLEIDAYNDADSTFRRLATDPMFLVDFLYVVCKPEADTLKITDEDFGRSLIGDAIEGATDAVLQAYVDFFPSARRKPLEMLLTKVQEGSRRATERIEKRTEEIGKALDRAIEAGVEEIDRKISGALTSSSPASVD